MVSRSERVAHLRLLAEEGGIYDPVVVTRLDLCALFEAYDALALELKEELDAQSP